jgi:hypothetical protein
MHVRFAAVCSTLLALCACGPTRMDDSSTAPQVGTSQQALCGSSCPAGQHVTSYYCDISCGSCQYVAGNAVNCAPDTGNGFSACWSCPSGYHVTSAACSSTCGDSPFACLNGSHSGLTCETNNQEAWSACGFAYSCPSGYHLVSNQCSNSCPDFICSNGVTNQYTCAVNDVCTIIKSQAAIGYGQMGRHDGCQYRDYCAGGLVPHNVNASPPYTKAADGYFSCWYNTPDVICHSIPEPAIHGYINVRQCYHRDDGSSEDYGCHDC